MINKYTIVQIATHRRGLVRLRAFRPGRPDYVQAMIIPEKSGLIIRVGDIITGRYEPRRDTANDTLYIHDNRVTVQLSHKSDELPEWIRL